MNPESMTFNASLGRKVGHCFKSPDVLRTTVRVPTIVKCVDTDEDVVGFEHLSVGQSVRQEDSVPRRNVRDRNALAKFCDGVVLGHSDISCQGGSAKDPEVDISNDLAFDAGRLGNGAGCL